jgi:hypothetical protein
MITLNFVWKDKTGDYQTGEELKLNRISVAGYSWNGSRSQGHTDHDDWIGNVYLPGVNTKRYVATTESLMKMKLQDVVTKWFTEALQKAAK